MVKPVPLRTDFSATDLRELARSSKDATQARRLLALAAIYDGATRKEAATIAAVTAQIIRDWVVRFNAEGPAGLVNRKAPGKAPKLNTRQREELCRLVERGPIPSVDGVVRWRLKDLAFWVYQEYRISIDESTLGRMFKATGYAKLSARPYHHARNERLTEDLKKHSPRKSTRSVNTWLPAPK